MNWTPKLARWAKSCGWVATAVLVACSVRTRASSSEIRALVYNTHPGKDASGVDNLERVAAIVRDTKADIALLQEVDRGTDFNSTPESEQRILRSAGLRDSWLECGSGDGYSYPADSSIKRIDYLYQTRASSCLDAKVLRTGASDHRPVLFTLRL